MYSSKDGVPSQDGVFLEERSIKMKNMIIVLFERYVSYDWIESFDSFIVCIGDGRNRL